MPFVSPMTADQYVALFRLLTDRLWATTLIAVAIGVGSGLGGLAISSAYSVAAGGSITLLATLAFVVSLLASPRHGLLSRALTRPAPLPELPATG